MERNTAGFFRPPTQYLWAVKELFVLQMNAVRELHSSESRDSHLRSVIHCLVGIKADCMRTQRVWAIEAVKITSAMNWRSRMVELLT